MVNGAFFVYKVAVVSVLRVVDGIERAPRVTRDVRIVTKEIVSNNVQERVGCTNIAVVHEPGTGSNARECTVMAVKGNVHSSAANDAACAIKDE